MTTKPDEPPKAVESSSGIPLKSFYTADDIPESHRSRVNLPPGEAPYHRGFHPNGYRSKPWRIFQLSGFGKPEDENERIKPDVEVGQRVLYGKYSGTEVSVDGEEYLILRESDILAVIH